MKNGKIVVIGDPVCGKTCLLQVFKSNEFPKEYLPTVVDNFIKEVEYEKDNFISLAFLDTAVQQDYDKIRPLSYQGIDVVLFCFAIDNSESLTNIESKWLKEIKKHCPSTTYMLVGLKEDLRDSETDDKSGLITFEQAKSTANKMKIADYIECSALTRKNVDLVFQKAAKLAVNRNSKIQLQENCCCGFLCF